jgi:CubicO group peptidase (beta-lactamase class C family)
MVEGYVAPGFERVRETFEANLSEELGAGFAAVRNGEVLVDIWGGFADRARSKAWTRDTIVPVYSATKGVSAIIMAWLNDKKLIDYEAPLAALWPEFGAHGKDKLTIAQALSHQAGVPGFAEPIDPALWLDPPACAGVIASLRPMWPPGTANGYHPLTWGYIAGEITRRASGRSLGSILREEICKPHGIDFRIGGAESEEHRIAEIRKPPRAADFGEITPPRQAAFFTPWSAPNRNASTWRRIEIPSANGHGTALSLARLYEIYASEGEIAGERVLSREGFAALIAPRIKGDDLVLPFHMDWRTGVFANASGAFGPNPDAIGHTGAGGSCAFGDAKARVSVGYVMNQHAPTLLGDQRSLRLIDALYACL